jgi:hypothetical protein
MQEVWRKTREKVGRRPREMDNSAIDRNVAQRFAPQQNCAKGCAPAIQVATGHAGRPISQTRSHAGIRLAANLHAKLGVFTRLCARIVAVRVKITK